jgi:hypothetical protein
VAAGRKTGGRVAGTPNRATRRLKTFLDGVFEQAFATPEFRELLLRQIVTLQIDTKLLQTLMAYSAGKPPQAHEHSGAIDVNLARIIAGPLPHDENDEPEDET